MERIARLAWIHERTKEVEQRGDAQFATRRANIFHAVCKEGRMEKADATLFHRAAQGILVVGELYAVALQYVA